MPYIQRMASLGAVELLILTALGAALLLGVIAAAVYLGSRRR